MIERKIRLTDTEEVKDFVRAAGKCDFDIDVCYNRAVIDAKSLLGMLYLGIGRGNSTRSGKEIILFHHIKRLAKGGALAGLAVIGREKLLELLYRCL